jgi:hypothetical protein
VRLLPQVSAAHVYLHCRLSFLASAVLLLVAALAQLAVRLLPQVHADAAYLLYLTKQSVGEVICIMCGGMCDRMCWFGICMHACHDVCMCRPAMMVAAIATVWSQLLRLLTLACLLHKAKCWTGSYHMRWCGGACVMVWILHACCVVWVHPCDPYMQ